LINNSGVNKIDEITKINLKDWNKIINVNVTGAFILTNLIAKKMKKHKGGKILNVSSIFSVVGKNKRSSYSSSKWALVGLTKSSALDLSEFNILVNAISPGVIESNLTKKILGNKGIQKIKKDIPLNKLAKLNEIVNVINFLVSDQNSYMTGQNIIVDGGYTCA
jgi:Dehydrogenases with different specificities (related to short-chain alcohol dehydrogenases)